VNVFPTATILPKISHTNFTLRIDLLDTSSINIAAFVYIGSKGEKVICIIKDGFYYEKNNTSKKTGLYSLQATTVENIQYHKPAIAKQMDSLLPHN
jgi:hypothetical protein